MRFFAPALFVAALLAPTVLAGEPSPIDHRIAPSVEAQRPVAGVHKRTYRHKAVRSSKASSGSLVAIQCGPRTIRVAGTASAQFAGFCREFYAAYRFTNRVGGVRGGSCHQGGKHPCGGAIDIDQMCRSARPGHCGIAANWPVALSERLADKWGLQPGSRWGHRDIGHFETKGTLAGVGWKGPKETMQLASTPPAEAKHPLLGAQMASADVEQKVEMPKDQERHPMGDDLLAKFKPKADAALYYIYSEVPLGPKDRPVAALVASMQSVPVASPHVEIGRAARLFEKSEAMMLAFAKIESSFNCKNRTGSYKGLFQLSDTEFRKYGYGDIWNCRDNAIAAANKFATEGEMYKRAYGRTASFSDHYLIHQQGWRGAEEHVDSPNDLAWKNMCKTGEGKQKGLAWCKLAIWGNVPCYFKAQIKGGVEALTSGEFVNYWRDKVDRIVAGKPSLASQACAVKKYAKKKKKWKHRSKVQYAGL